MQTHSKWGRRFGDWATGSMVLGAGLLHACQLPPAPEVTPSPQRPSLSFDAAIVPPGDLEMESGLTLERHGSWSVPSALKYGWDDKTELSLGWSPWNEVHQDGGTVDSTGDVTLAARRVVRDGGPSSFSSAMQVLVKLPTADERDGIGSGEVDWSLAGVLTLPRGNTGWLAYGSLDSLGDPDGGTKGGFSAALAASAPVGDNNTGFVELANVSVPDWGTEQYWITVGIGIPWAEQWIGDVGFSLGLNEEAPDWQVLVGFTHTLGRIRPLRP